MTRPAPAAPPASPPPALIAAVRRILRPLVRVLIHFGITFPSLSVLLKGVYVEQAERHFRLTGKSMTDSRVTLLTGVHRKDVSRLRGADAEDGAGDLPRTLGAQVVGRWLGDAAFRTDDGQPRPLPRTADDDAPSFETLVTGISRDLRPRAVLDEFLHSGLVRARDDGWLELARAADLPTHDLDKLAFYYGRNIGDHLEAASHNVMKAVGAAGAADDPPLLERAVFHDGLSAESVAALRAEAERRAMEALIALNEQAVRLAEADAGTPGASGRFSAGVYVYARPGGDSGRAPDGGDS